MRFRRILAVVRRDLQVALGSKAVVVPAILVPVLLLVVLPVGLGLAPRFLDAAAFDDLAPLLANLPPEVVAGLPEDPVQQGAVVTLTYLLTPLILIIPVMLASVLASDSVAGEQERRTLEALLLTPLTDRELATAKVLGAWLPAVSVGLVGGVLYALAVNLTLGVTVGQQLLPTPGYLMLVLWVAPTFAAAALGIATLVSVRVRTTQEAFQLAGVVVLPVVGLVVAQAVGALLLSPGALALVGVGALAVAVLVVLLAARALARPRLGPRLG